MSSNIDQIAAGQNEIPNTLRERVEGLAVRLVLGGTDGPQWAVLLTDVCREAETTGRADVAGIAAEALEALAHIAGTDSFETVFSASIACMQQVLAEGGAEAAPPRAVAELPFPTASAAPPCSLGEDSGDDRRLPSSNHANI